MMMSSPSTPEQVLSELFDLAAKVEARIACSDASDLLEALRVARAVIAERIRTTANASKPPLLSEPVDFESLKAGDKVWVLGCVITVDEADSARSVYLVFADGDVPHFQRAWPDVTRLRRAV
jgi:hypothetical protein